MRDFIENYRSKPWPKLEVPPIQRPQLTVLILFVCLLIGGGWYIWFAGQIRAENFLYLGFAIPVLFFLKNRYVTIVGLLSFQVIVAFLFMGNSNYAILAIIFLIGAIISFEAPILVYCILILGVWFEKYFATSVTTQFVIGSGLLTGWAFKSVIKFDHKPTKILFPERWPAIFFLIWATIGLFFWSYDFGVGWLQLKWIILGILFFIISPLIVRKESQLNLIILAWVSSALIAAFLTTFELSFGTQSSSNTAVTWLAQKNVTATFLSLSFFIVLALYASSKTLTKKLFIFLIGMGIFIVIYLTYSRGTMIGLTAGIISFWFIDSFLNKGNKINIVLIIRTFIILSTVVLLLLGVYYLGLDELIGNYSELFLGSVEETTGQFRIETWVLVIDIIANENHFLRGLGLGAFWIIGPEYGNIVVDWTEDPGLASPHNLYLDLLLHYGLIGFILFMWLILLNLWRIWKVYRQPVNKKFRYLSLGLLCSLISYYVHGMIDGQLYPLTDFWLYLGLVVIVININTSSLREMEAKTGDI